MMLSLSTGVHNTPLSADFALKLCTFLLNRAKGSSQRGSVLTHQRYLRLMLLLQLMQVSLQLLQLMLCFICLLPAALQSCSQRVAAFMQLPNCVHLLASLQQFAWIVCKNTVMCHTDLPGPMPITDTVKMGSNRTAGPFQQ